MRIYLIFAVKRKLCVLVRTALVIFLINLSIFAAEKNILLGQVLVFAYLRTTWCLKQNVISVSPIYLKDSHQGGYHDLFVFP